MEGRLSESANGMAVCAVNSRSQYYLGLSNNASYSRFLAFTLQPEVLSLPYPVTVGILWLYFSWIYTHLLPIRPKLLKFYNSVDQGENRVVLAKPNVLPRMKLGPALANYNGAGLGGLVAVDLDAESLAFGVSAVLGAPRSFLVRILNGQREPPCEGDGGWLGTRRA